MSGYEPPSLPAFGGGARTRPVGSTQGVDGAEAAGVRDSYLSSAEALWSGTTHTAGGSVLCGLDDAGGVSGIDTSTIRSVQPLNRALDAAVIKVPHRQVMEEVLSIPEIQKVLAYQKEKESWFYPVFALWLSTGLRNAELIGLTWDAVRLAEGELLITKSLRRDGVNTHLRRWGTTKTGRSRVVPLNPEIVDLF